MSHSLLMEIKTELARLYAEASLYPELQKRKPWLQRFATVLSKVGKLTPEDLPARKKHKRERREQNAGIKTPG